MSVKLKNLLLPVLLCLAASGAHAAEGFPLGSGGWKYRLGTSEASAPMNAWRAIVFDDSSWNANAVTPIGYGDVDGATSATITPTSATTDGNYLSVYYRKTFVVADPAAIVTAALDAKADDGLIVWVNGTEVARANVAAGDQPFSAQALGATTPEANPISVANVASLLVAGTNVIAIHGFNYLNTSSDMFMDASLTVTEDSAPIVESSTPARNSTVTSLTFVNVLFDKNVSGVDITDLTVNGAAATGFLNISAREFQWNFTQPPTGTVTIALAPGGIVDTVGAPNPFAGTNWTCTLNPNAAPTGARITEFLTDNNVGIEDEDGSRSDWIEVYNPGPLDLNLYNWSLTDDTNSPTKWRFPSLNLAAGRYLVVMASGKDRTNVAGPYLHTNFQLEKNAPERYLALLNPATNVVSSYSVAAGNYPVQNADISYGLDGSDPVLHGYFITPTPGSNNLASGSSLAPEPQFSLNDGIYTASSLTLTMTAPAGLTIRYTFDGSEPTGSSLGGASPVNITFTTNMMIKARTYSPTTPNPWPSKVVGRKFIMLDASTANFSSDLPIVIFSTQGRGISANLPPGAARPRGQIVAIDTYRGRAALTGPVDTHEFSAHEIVGQTSAGFPKQPQRLEVNDEVGNDKKVPLLGLPAEGDWNFRNPYSDKCLMNDFLGYELWEDMGNYSCRRRFVELFIDTGGGKLSYPGDYYGVMVLFERIERGKNRVNIEELTRFATNEPAISGGYIFKKDKDSTGDLNFNTSGGAGFSGQALKMHEPKPAALNNSASHPQVVWLRNYLNLFESALYSASWTNASVLGTTNHYSNYIDVDKFVDQHLHVEFTRQIDGYRLSSYYAKDRGGKMGPTPIWDWNLSFGNANYYNGGLTNGWYFASDGENQHPWLRRLNFGGTAITPTTGGDPEFRQRTTDRWAVLRTNALNGARIADRIDQIATNLTEAAARNFSKYNILNTYIWPNPEGGTWHVDYTKPTYPEIISEMKKWVIGRYTWMDEQFMKAPIGTLNGGSVPAGTTFTMSAPEGSIYYTTNGTDPRAVGGGISPSAIAYSPGSPVTISGNARLFARAYNSGTVRWTRWSPPLQNTYVVRTNRFVITEIMYAPPAPPAGSPYTAEDFEYIELRNVDGGPLNVTGSRLSGGIDFTFPSLTLADGQRVLVVRNLAAFSSRYNTAGLTIAGEYTGNLANEGNRLHLRGPVGETLLDFDYNNKWYPTTEGFGFSLVINDDAAPFSTWGLASSWRPSGSLSGSPGLDNGAPVAFPSVVINEVLTSSTPPATDTIELRNLSGSPANIGGWFLTDDPGTPKKFRIPPGTTIPGNGYLSFSEADFNTGANGNTPFALSSLGDEVHLYSGDANTNLTGYVQGFDFGAQVPGRTFGRHVISTGADHFVAQASATPNGANSGPLVGPVVISEINYHPVDVVNGYGSFDNTEDEYIELHNRTASSVNLYDPAAPTNRWRLRDAVSFTFPMGTTLPANGYALVVSFDPANASALAAFRANNGVPAGVPVYGPYSGQLDNSSDSVELVMPDSPTNNTVPYVLVDKVRYTDTAPWPAAADGIGLVLLRTVESDYGNDPTNWVAAGRSPGASYVPGPVPVITAQPQSVAALATSPVSLSVTASGTPPLSYQWRFRPVGGSSFTPILGAAASSLDFSSVQISDAGSYDCIVANTAGAVVSSNATLSVVTPANIVSHPTNISMKVPPDSGAPQVRVATFRVVATTDNPPLTFQWQRDGTNLPIDLPTYTGVTSPTLTITNVMREDGGTFRCAVTDASGTIYSSNAVLLTLVTPIIIQSPQSQTILQGQPVTFTVVVSNASTGPFNYIWRYQSTIIASNHMVASYSNSHTFNNVLLQATNLNRYRCDVQNGATIGQGIPSATAYVTVLADLDSDGVADAWELEYGFSTNNPADALSDFDNDLMNNRDEYLAGTDPTDPASVLKVTDFLYGVPNTFNFLAISNRTYSVQSGSTVPAGPWQSFTNISAEVTNRTIQISTPALPAPRYIRIVTPEQP